MTRIVITFLSLASEATGVRVCRSNVFKLLCLLYKSWFGNMLSKICTYMFIKKYVYCVKIHITVHKKLKDNA